MAVCDMKVMDTLNLFYNLSMRFQLAVVNHVYLQMTFPSSLSVFMQNILCRQVKTETIIEV
uniref:Bm13643 n=1 Tax=Brugia malayi TaxID=6279 RepID=A0A1I9G6A1_BRUMA|nr:Bm13643 [Brugia malayi]